MSLFRTPLRFFVFFNTIALVLLFYRGYISQPLIGNIVEERQPISPHTGSWQTWFNPFQSKVKGENHTGNRWNILHHLGGNGPWIEHTGGESSLAPPEECLIDQVHLV